MIAGQMQLGGGEALGFDRALSQFHTPQPLADRMAAWAGVSRNMRVLEPCAGGGNIARACMKLGAQVTAVEIDKRWADKMVADPSLAGAEIAYGDFLRCKPGDLGPPHDLVVMNSPFEKQADALFIAHAITFAPRVVALDPVGVLFGKKKNELVWSRRSLTGLVIITRRPKFLGSGGSFDCALVEVDRAPGLPCRRVERW